jgi:hypothetical protein
MLFVVLGLYVVINNLPYKVHPAAGSVYVVQPADYVVRVNRSLTPTYPNWIARVEHPELELAGPRTYNLSTIRTWLDDGQKNGGVVSGLDVYQHLKKNRALSSCLNLQDGIAIRQKSRYQFIELFGATNSVYLWGSVVKDHNGKLRVPYLYHNGDGIALNWRLLDSNWFMHDPALQFSTQ